MSIAIIGGTGSVGSILIEALLKTNIKSITSISRDEHKINMMKRKLKDHRVNYLIADITNHRSINRALKGINIVIHAAALKHVITGEHFPYEVINTNVIGTDNIIRACHHNSVEKLIYISTDKAVEPCNVYGMSKHIAEKIVLNELDLNTCIVRSGNIIGSRGSIIPYFKWLIGKGKTIPLTDEKMRRWFIKKDVITNLIINLIDNSIDKAVYVPTDMKLIKIIDIIKLLKCKYKIIGKQEGEKLTEKLFWDYERPIKCGDYYLIGDFNDK